MSLSDFHELFQAQLGKTRIDPNKAFSRKLAFQIAKILDVTTFDEMTLDVALAPIGQAVAIAQRLKKPFDLNELMKKGLKGELRDLLDELESRNPDADFRIGFFGRRGSGMKDMVFTNSDLLISNRFSYIRIPNPLSSTPELYLQTIDGFIDNLPMLKK